MPEPRHSRQDVASVLRRAGFRQAADEALRALPDTVDIGQILAFLAPYGISKDDIISQLGGSPLDAPSYECHRARVPSGPVPPG